MDITKYYPQVSLEDAFHLDENIDDKELTFKCFELLKKARLVQDAVFIVIGRLLKLVRDRKLYTYLDFETFEQFLASEELSFSREKAYAYIRIYELYVEKLQLDENKVREIGVTRLMMLSPIIKQIDDPQEAVEKIEDLSQLRYSDFVRQVKSEVNKDGKPEVYWNERLNLWVVNYYEDKTALNNLGKYADRQENTPRD